MLMTFGILIITALIILFEKPKLKKNGEKKTIWTFSILLLIGVSLSIAIAFKVNIPSPFDLFTFIFQPVANLIKAVLKQ